MFSVTDSKFRNLISKVRRRRKTERKKGRQFEVVGRGQEEEEGTSSSGHRRNRILGDRVAGLFVEETERRFDSNITQDSPSTGHRQTHHTHTHTHTYTSHISVIST